MKRILFKIGKESLDWIDSVIIDLTPCIVVITNIYPIILPPFLEWKRQMKIDAAGLPKTLVTLHQTSRYHILCTHSVPAI